MSITSYRMALKSDTKMSPSYSFKAQTQAPGSAQFSIFPAVTHPVKSGLKCVRGKKGLQEPVI